MGRRVSRRTLVHVVFILAIAGLTAWAIRAGTREAPVQVVPPEERAHLVPMKQMYSYGYMGMRGQWVIEPKYQAANKFRGDRALVRLNDKWGYIDRTGAMVIPAQFGAACDFVDGTAVVMDGATGKAGCIDESGAFIVKPTYDAMGAFVDGLAMVQQGGQWGFVDRDGKVAVPITFEEVRYFEPPRPVLLVRVKGKWGVVDRTGAAVTPPQFDNVAQRADGYTLVEWGNRPQTAYVYAPEQLRRVTAGEATLLDIEFGLLKPDGTLLPGSHDAIEGFHEGLAAVNEGGRTCQLNRTGYGSDRVFEGGAWGYIDETGAVVIEPRFDSAGAFLDGKAAVVLDGKRLVIDKTGAVVEELGPEESPE